LIERRKYLLESAGSDRSIGAAASRTVEGLVPEDAHFASAGTAAGSSAAEAIRRTLLGDSATERTRNERLDLSDPGDFFEYGGSYYGYEYLDSRFDQKIDEQEEEVRTAGGERERSELSALRRALGGTDRVTLLEVLEPTPQPVPLFADFRRGGAVVTGSTFDAAGFEESVKKIVTLNSGVSRVDLDLVWKKERIGKSEVRSLELPMLGRSFYYSRIAGGVAFANSRDLIAKMLRQKNGDRKFAADPSLSSASIINVHKGKDSYEAIFGRLNPDAKADDFFKGNIASLFGAFPDLDSITTETRVRGQFVEKGIVFHITE